MRGRWSNDFSNDTRPVSLSIPEFPFTSPSPPLMGYWSPVIYLSTEVLRKGDGGRSQGRITEMKNGSTARCSRKDFGRSAMSENRSATRRRSRRKTGNLFHRHEGSRSARHDRSRLRLSLWSTESPPSDGPILWSSPTPSQESSVGLGGRRRSGSSTSSPPSPPCTPFVRRKKVPSSNLREVVG